MRTNKRLIDTAEVVIELLSDGKLIAITNGYNTERGLLLKTILELLPKVSRIDLDECAQYLVDKPIEELILIEKGLRFAYSESMHKQQLIDKLRQIQSKTFTSGIHRPWWDTDKKVRTKKPSRQ